VAWGGDDEDDPDHVALVHRHAGNIAAPRRLRRRIFIGGDATLPCLLPLDAVVVLITLGNLALFVLRLAHSASPLRCRLVLVEYRLLRERCFSQNEVGALQLQRQEGRKVSRSRRPPRRLTSQQKHTRSIEKIITHKFFVPPLGSIRSSRYGDHE
jgi:hypothetical protein